MKLICFLAKNSRLTLIVSCMAMLLVLHKVFNITDFLVTLLIMVPFTLLMPRKRIINTETGEKIKITWFLLKDPIILEK